MMHRFVRSPWTRGGATLLALSAVHLWFWGLVDLTRTINLVELEWSVVALIGIIYSSGFIRECWLNGRAVDQREEARRLTIEAFILIGCVLAGLHFILLVFGISALVAPTSPVGRAVGYRLLAISLTIIGESMVLILAKIRRNQSRIRELNLEQIRLGNGGKAGSGGGSGGPDSTINATMADTS